MPVQACQYCEGTGSIVEDTGGFYPNGSPILIGVTCPGCEGKGTMPAVAELSEKLDEQIKRFTTGAIRSADGEDVRYDLIPPEAKRRLAERLALGSKKYGDDNWKKGIPVGNIINHLENHLEKWKLDGCLNDDNLGGAMWGIMVLMWYEKHKPELLREYGVPVAEDSAKAD